MAYLYNPFRVQLTYESGEEVLDCYMHFGATTDQSQPPQFDGGSITAIQNWLNAAVTAIGDVLQGASWRSIGAFITVPYEGTYEACLAPVRLSVLYQGTAGISFPPDSVSNIRFVGTRPDSKPAYGGIRLSSPAKAAIDGGRWLSTTISDFVQSVVPELESKITLPGQADYYLGIKGAYKPTPEDEPIPYFVKADSFQLAPVVGSRKDRIPNRSNWPKGSNFPV